MAIYTYAQIEARVPADVIKFGQPGVAFVCVKRTQAIQSLFIKANKLVFQKKEVDPSSGEVSEDFSEEEYPLDELEVAPSRVHSPMTVLETCRNTTMSKSGACHPQTEKKTREDAHFAPCLHASGMHVHAEHDVEGFSCGVFYVK
jgi:hypothetical protein